jgi:hypothetical protein
MREHPKATETTTELEKANVTVKKLRGFVYASSRNNVIMLKPYIAMKEDRMENPQASPVEDGHLCKKCGQRKPLGQFRLHTTPRNHVRKISNWCIECDREWHKQHRLTHPEVRARQAIQANNWRLNHKDKIAKARHDYRRKHDAENKAKIYEVYGNKCACCGETNPGFFTVDHVNSDGHLERKKGYYTSGSQFYEWLVKRNFPKEYQVLCYNCNLGRARNNGICPHREASTTMAEASTAERPEAPSAPEIIGAMI